MASKFFKTIGGYAGKGKKFIARHKIISGLGAAVLIGLCWWGVSVASSGKAETRYVLGTVSRGTIVSTVSASGQVSSSRSLEVKPQVSGTITYIAVKPGQTVAQGQLIASLDSSDAQKTLRDAQNNLETAQLALEKLQAPASGLTLVQAQNAVSSAQDSLARAYVDSQNDYVKAYLDLPDIMTDLQDIVIGTTASRGTQWNIDYYYNSLINSADQARAYRDDAYNTYVTAKAAYDKAFADYKALGNNPSSDQIEAMTGETSNMVKAVNDALKSSNALIQLYSNTLTGRNQTPSSVATAALSTISGDIASISSSYSTLMGDVSGLKSSKQSLTEKQLSLQDLQDGPDALDVRGDQLTIQQRQDAVTDARVELAKYSVRAPFAGTITAINQYVGDEGGSATLATLVTPQQIAKLSLNEVDAAKVKVGDKATLTFDAIEDLTLTGTVAQVDVAGTVSQGVVSYSIEIAFDTQDPGVKPGMTVNAAIQTDTAQDVLMVPSSAVKTSNGMSYVQAFTPALASTGGIQGVTSQTPPGMIEVTTGISDDTNIEILSGLAEGQQIVTRTISAGAKTTTSSNTNRATSGSVRSAGGFAAPAGGATFIRSF
jgi:HlyD family secretion protein